MNPTIPGVIGPGLLNQVPTLLGFPLFIHVYIYIYVYT